MLLVVESLNSMRLLTAVLLFAILFLETGHSQSLCDQVSRFQCGNGVCISIAKRCNGFQDCEGGEDEQVCDRIETCKPRNLTIARRNNYTCRGPCNRSRWLTGCRGAKKRCVCDDECGWSCINPDSQCEANPPEVPNASFEVRKMVPDRKKLTSYDFGPPYDFRAVAVYTCFRGTKLVGPFPRCSGRKTWSNELPICKDIVCHERPPVIAGASTYRFRRPIRGGETTILAHTRNPETGYTIEYECEQGLLLEGNPPVCGSDLRWTEHTSQCVVECFEDRAPNLIRRYGLQCGQQCNISSDCPDGMECYCDGPCSRVCVNPNVTCIDAPDIPHTMLNYSGDGIRKIARYQCQAGYYRTSGLFTLRCSGSENWIGERPSCQPIECGNPSKSIRKTGGQIYNMEGIHYGAQVSFYCSSSYRMLGSPERRCMGNGRWSGELTICDRLDVTHNAPERCPNPGWPINGRRIGEDFTIGAVVTFECDDEYVMYGTPVQECLWYKEWNGTVAPSCVNPNYPHSASDVIGTLSRYLKNLPEADIDLGRAIRKDDTGRAHEIYLMFDVSDSVIKDKKEDLKNEIEFAKRLVKRMKTFGRKVNYGIMLFASKNVTALDITAGQTAPHKVIEELDEIYKKAASKFYQRDTKSGTATAYALDQLRKQIALMYEDQVEDTARHVFLFTDGRHTEGKDPVETRKEISVEFNDDNSTIEFYSITACEGCNKEVQEELIGLSSEEDGTNYIYIDDFYQLDTYLDKVTNVTIDYSACGQAGKVGPTINKQAQLQLGRSVGGENAVADAWPWQALLVQKGNNMKRSLKKEHLKGGGSILNEHWILTAAHVFKGVDGAVNWKQNFAVFVGTFERRVLGSVEAYAIAEYHSHENYVDETTTGYDIALIKLGKLLDETMNEVQDADKDGLTFAYYVRPVCLPCTGTCLKKKQLVSRRNEPLVDDDMGFDEKCEVEEKLLLTAHAKAVVTGYGHLNSTKSNTLSRREFNPPRKLQQALLKILPDEKCQTGVENINCQLAQGHACDEDNERGGPVEYSDTMLCCESGIKDKTVGACKGDSGGPLVREVRDSEGKSCWVQIGIVSWGYGCGMKFPGYYTKVTKFIPWINETIGGTLPGI